MTDYDLGYADGYAGLPLDLTKCLNDDYLKGFSKGKKELLKDMDISFSW